MGAIARSAVDPPGDALALAQGQDALVSDHRTVADLVLITLNQTIRRHALEQQRNGGPRLFRHSQRLIHFSGTETSSGLIRVHREGAEHCPLVGSAKCFAVGDGGEHGVCAIDSLSIGARGAP